MSEERRTLATQRPSTPLSVWLLTAALLLLLLLLVVRLIFGDGSVQEVWRLSQETAQQREVIQSLRERNRALEAEVNDLRSGLEAIEERARSEMGMVRDGEIFYQFIDRERDAPVPPDTESPQ
ncbi:cell division protein FtsB [Granulosicoccaceae sp. 1_MG-2023]|nr:cell division protein FtsB [Granulosicoccaceae sp. 1_MG-2023]